MILEISTIISYQNHIKWLFLLCCVMLTLCKLHSTSIDGFSDKHISWRTHSLKNTYFEEHLPTAASLCNNRFCNTSFQSVLSTGKVYETLLFSQTLLSLVLKNVESIVYLLSNYNHVWTANQDFIDEIFIISLFHWRQFFIKIISQNKNGGNHAGRFWRYCFFFSVAW